MKTEAGEPQATAAQTTGSASTAMRLAAQRKQPGYVVSAHFQARHRQCQNKTNPEAVLAYLRMHRAGPMGTLGNFPVCCGKWVIGILAGSRSGTMVWLMYGHIHSLSFGRCETLLAETLPEAITVGQIYHTPL